VQESVPLLGLGGKFSHSIPEKIYAVFTHADFRSTERKACIKVFSCCRGHVTCSLMKRVESLLKAAGLKFEF